MDNVSKYKKIWIEINKNNFISIFTHINPDGDTIGCAIALKELILINTNNKEVKISGDHFPYVYDFLGKTDHVPTSYIEKSLSILVDTPSIKRTFDKRILLGRKIIKIDHHHPFGDEWIIAIDGDHYPATGQILYEMIISLKLKVNKKILEAIFVSIWTDTSGLVERNVSKQTFYAIDWIKEFGIDIDKIIDKMKLSIDDQKIVDKLISGVKNERGIAYVINDDIISNDLYRPSTEKFYKSNSAKVYLFASRYNEKSYRIGLRSKGFDVSKIAEKYNGGGHVRSSGAKVNSKDEIMYILNDIERGLNENN